VNGADTTYVKENNRSNIVVLFGNEEKEKDMKLKIGQQAPDFKLPSHLGRPISLSDYRGKNVVLAFFPLAWTPV